MSHASTKTRLASFGETAFNFVGSLCMLGLLIGVVVSAASLMFSFLNGLGADLTVWQFASLWVLVGIPCALFWPFKYRKGMKGQWRQSIPQLGFLSLLGPFALIFGFPL